MDNGHKMWCGWEETMCQAGLSRGHPWHSAACRGKSCHWSYHLPRQNGPPTNNNENIFPSKLSNIFRVSNMLLVFLPNLLQAAPSCLAPLLIAKSQSGLGCVEVSSFSKSLIIRIMAGRNSLDWAATDVFNVSSTQAWLCSNLAMRCHENEDFSLVKIYWVDTLLATI